MASVVSICNRALQLLGAKKITSIDQDSTSARACKACYDELRKAELRSNTWNFAIERASLSADATAPEWGRTNAFQLPTDFLRLAPRYEEDNQFQKDWQIEGKKILTNESAPLYLRYVRDVTDPNDMDPSFREALAHRMANGMCEELTQSNTKKQSIAGDYLYVIRDAKKINAIEKGPTTAPQGEWVTDRA